MKNELVVVPEMAGSGLAGAVVFWSLSGEIDCQLLRQRLTEAGVAEENLPTEISAEAATRRAVKELEAKRRLVRPLGSGDGWVIVDESADGDRLTYASSLTVKTGAWISFDPVGHPLEQQIEDNFRRHLKVLSSGDIGNWLVRQAGRLNAVTLRDSGGFYFIPAGSLPAWQQLAAVIQKAGHAMFEIPALPSDKAIEAVVYWLSEEARQEADRIDERLSKDDLGARALRSREEKVNQLISKVASYEKLLGRSLDLVKQRLESLEANVVAAALAAEAEEEAA